jgi:flagellar assembly protein FliH
VAKGVLTKIEAEKIAVNYAPRKFPATIAPVASSFVAYQNSQNAAGATSSFKIDHLVAKQTGIAELERISIEERVEQEALARLKEMQEQTYEQAYQLGFNEGREKAYTEARTELEAKLDHLSKVLGSIEGLKSDLVAFNETHIMHLIFHMARKIAMGEIAENRELILGVVKQAVESAQSDENVTVRVSPEDFAFIEQIKESLGKEHEPVKRAKLEASDEITDGGCIIETNYGDVDATVEQRVEKLWESLVGKLPKVKSKIKAEAAE